MKSKTVLARRLRQNTTDAERKLRKELRGRKLAVKFRRQQPIGKYIADFVCYEELLIIEVDGGQHAESEKDKARDEYFKKKKYKVLRYWNNDVLQNTKGILQDIMSNLHPPPGPLPRREGGDVENK